MAAPKTKTTTKTKTASKNPRKNTKAQLLSTPVEHIDMKSFDARPIIDAMGKMSFTSRDTSRAAVIFNMMLADQKCSNILTLAGSTSAGGCMQVYVDMVKCGMIDAIVSTGASIVDMDFFEALGFKHYQGSQFIDDRDLRANYIDRIYDTYIDEEELQHCDKVIGEIGADEVPKLLVFNKIDFCGDAEAQQARREFLQAAYPECFIMSALNTADVALVRQKIVDFFKTQLAEAELYVPWSAQKARGEIFSQCRVQDERSDEHGTFFSVLAEPALIEELQARFPQPAS